MADDFFVVEYLTQLTFPKSEQKLFKSLLCRVDGISFNLIATVFAEIV